MIQTENNTDSIEKIVAILYQVSEHLQGFTRSSTEIREFVRKAAGNIPPLLLDKETLCRKLNIAERTLYRDIKDYNIPVHKLGQPSLFLLGRSGTIFKSRKSMKTVTNLVSAVGEIVDRLTLPEGRRNNWRRTSCNC